MLALVDDVPQCYVDNDWICAQYWSDYRPELVDAFVQHLWLTVISVVAGLVVAVPLALLARRRGSTESLVVGATTVIYTIPSLALFSLLLPFTGLTPTTVIIGLALYSLTVLVRNIVAGLQGVPRRWSRPPAASATPDPAAAARRAAAGTAGDHGGAAGRHRVHGRPGDDRLDRLVRRPRQPAAARGRQPVQGPDLRGERAVRRARGRPGPPAGRVQRLLTPGRAMLGDVLSHLTDGANWSGPNGIGAFLVQQLLLTVTALVVAVVIGLPPALYFGHRRRMAWSPSTSLNVGRAVPVFAVLLVLALGPVGSGSSAPTGAPAWRR